MQITQITKNQIFGYHDYSFFVFDRQALVVNAPAVGVMWAAGKAKDPLDAKPEVIMAHTIYHNHIISTLIHLIAKDKSE